MFGMLAHLQQQMVALLPSIFEKIQLGLTVTRSRFQNHISGHLHYSLAVIERPTFRQLIKNGLRFNVSVAIDFAGTRYQNTFIFSGRTHTYRVLLWLVSYSRCE